MNGIKILFSLLIAVCSLNVNGQSDSIFAKHGKGSNMYCIINDTCLLDTFSIDTCDIDCCGVLDDSDTCVVDSIPTPITTEYDTTNLNLSSGIAKHSDLFFVPVALEISRGNKSLSVYSLPEIRSAGTKLMISKNINSTALTYGAGLNLFYNKKSLKPAPIIFAGVSLGNFLFEVDYVVQKPMLFSAEAEMMLVSKKNYSLGFFLESHSGFHEEIEKPETELLLGPVIELNLKGNSNSTLSFGGGVSLLEPKEFAIEIGVNYSFLKTRKKVNNTPKTQPKIEKIEKIIQAPLAVCDSTSDDTSSPVLDSYVYDQDTFNYKDNYKDYREGHATNYAGALLVDISTSVDYVSIDEPTLDTKSKQRVTSHQMVNCAKPHLIEIQAIFILLLVLSTFRSLYQKSQKLYKDIE